MADFKLESWEHEPLWLKLLTPFLKKKRFPTLPSQPKPGQWYRIYPEGCVDANGEAHLCQLSAWHREQAACVFFRRWAVLERVYGGPAGITVQ